MKVLVCPLDWGLGHATRCIPLVRALVRNGHDVLLAASGGGRRLLAAEFPELEVVDFPGYPVRYSESAATLLPVLLAQLPGILLGMLRERRSAEALAAERGIDLIISDGRYGVRSRRLPGVFVTHQLAIRPPGNLPGKALASRVLLALNRRLLAGFDAVWVPDFPGRNNLSGELGHVASGPPRVAYIGPLSRFHPVDRDWSKPPAAGGRGPVVDVLASVSGPEPQRTRFEAAMREVLGRMSGTRVLVRGLPGASAAAEARIEAGNLNVFDHLDGGALGSLFATATLVVARSGYTTLMEMASLGVRQAVLVPTPGQPEQEYLADHLDAAGIAPRMDQESLDLKEAQRRMGRYRGFAAFRDHGQEPPTARLASLDDFVASHPLFRPAAGERLPR